MNFLTRILRSKIFWVLAIIALIIRVYATGFLLKKANAFLAGFSPLYKVHIHDLDLGILRGAYKIKGLEASLKKGAGDRFLAVDLIDVSLAWRELFRGKFVTDVMVDGAHFTLTDKVLDVFKAAKSQTKNDSKEATDKLFPARLERLDIKHSSFEVADMLSLPKSQRWRLTDIQVRASNLTPSEDSPRTLATMQGKLFDQAVVRSVANLDLLSDPPLWDADLELKDFNLPTANEFLKRKLPLSITSGKLDLFAEAISQNNRIEGYAKPFLKKADIVADKEKFKGFKHAAIEISSAAANLFFRSAKDRTVATKINFSYDEAGLKINSAKALMDAFKNGFVEEIPEGIDDEIAITNANRKEKKL